jgi:hypothetical protein
LSLSARIRLFFARAWQAAREVGTVLHACRFSLFMVLAGGTLMFASSQGRDLAVGLTGAPLLAQVAFQFAVLLWAFESWYWSRLLLDVTYGLDRRRPALGATHRASSGPAPTSSPGSRSVSPARGSSSGCSPWPGRSSTSCW